MKFKFYTILFLAFLIISCKDDEAKRQAEQLKDLKKKELVFDEVNKNWNFSFPVLEPQAQALVANWKEWRVFLSELKQKPQSSIGAFQQKSKTLATKAADLNIAIPQKLNQPAVKSRLAVLLTQMRSLNLYLNLQDIPQQKVIALIPEINTAITSLETQFEEIVRKEQIPIEQGESDMIKMLDTSRAIPNHKIAPKN